MKAPVIGLTMLNNAGNASRNAASTYLRPRRSGRFGAIHHPLQRERAFDAVHPGDAGQLGAQELLIRAKVGRHDPQQVVAGPRHDVALHHLRQLGYRALELASR